jgi:hypothetical protein
VGSRGHDGSRCDALIYLLLLAGHVALTFLVVKYINPWIEEDLKEVNNDEIPKY